MLKTLATITLVTALAGVSLAAQTKTPPAPTPKAERPSENRTPEPPALPVNVRIEVSITDQTGNGTPARKVVSMIAADRQATNIRSTATVPVKTITNGMFAPRTVTINVDARPMILPKDPNKVLVNLGLEYLPKSGGGGEETEPGMTSFSERLGLILESGKPVVISQAADPASDRRISVEVTATILK